MSDSATTSAAAGTHTGESRLGDARRIMTFPHMGEYHYAIRALADLTGADVLVPPKITRKTIELGAKHSPEFVCVPFKYNLGNFIEALDRGANVVVQVGGGCRFSYYAEVQEAILRDLGYEFEFIRLEGGAWKKFRYVTVPLSRNATFTVILLSFISGLRTFDLIWTMTGGGPGFTTDVLTSSIYKQYQAGFYGLATAGNVVLFIAVMLLVYPMMRFFARKEIEL